MGWKVGVFEISRITLTTRGEKKQDKITPQRGILARVGEKGLKHVGAFKKVEKESREVQRWS